MSEITAAFIEKHHPRVKELMLKRQVEQGNEKNWKVFEGDIEDCDCGFVWGATPEQYDVWHQAFRYGNFAPLYELHPEWGEQPTEPKPLIDGELEQIIKGLEDALIGLDDMNAASWGYEEGVLLTGNEAQKIIDFYRSIHPEPIKKPN
jgi:hypothetical protein